MARGRGGRPGVGGEQHRDVVGRTRAVHLHLDTARSMASDARWPSTAAASAGAAARRAAATAAAAWSSARTAAARAASRAAARSSCCSSSARRAPASSAWARTAPSESPYLRSRSWRSWRRTRHDLDPEGVLLDPLADAAQVARQVRQLGRHPAQPALEVGERHPVGQRRDGLAEGVDGASLVGQRGDRPLGGGPVGHRVGEQGLLGLQPLVLVRAADAGRRELVDLEAEQVDLAGPGPRVAPEGGQLGVDGPHAGAGLAQRSEVDRRRSGRGRLAARPGTAGTGGRAARAGRRGARPTRPARRSWPAGRSRRRGCGPSAGIDPGEDHLAVGRRR